MIKTQNLNKILELVIWTGYLKGEQAVSALLTATVESGKTELVTQYADNKGLVLLSDATAYGIMRDYKDGIVKGEIKHLVISDLIKPLSRGKDTVHGLIAFLNSLIEEGVIRISTYAERIGIPDPNATNQVAVVPVRAGLITTIAKSFLMDGRHHWAKMGFMSRMLPVSYEYSPATQLEIQQSIAHIDHLNTYLSCSSPLPAYQFLSKCLPF